MGVVLTMNAPLAYYQQAYAAKLADQVHMFRGLNGKVQVLPCCDTLQVNDYGKYNMAGFSEAHKQAHRAAQFPLDLRQAYAMGAALCAPGNE